MTEPTPVTELTYENAVMELERIVAELDEGSIDIDALSKEFQRAIDIVENLDGRIAKARSQVASLAPRLEAIGETKSED